MQDKEVSLWLKSLFVASQTTTVREFKSFVFSHLQSLVKFDSGLWTTRSDMFDKVNVHWVEDSFLYNQPNEFMENYFRIASAEHGPDLLNEYLTHHPDQFVDLWQVVTVEQWRQSVYYTEHCKPFGVEHALAALAAKSENTSVSHAISFYRANYDNPFSDEERACVNFLLPFLLQAFRLNLIYSFMPHDSGRVVRAVLDRFGVVIEAQESFVCAMEKCGLLKVEGVDLQGLNISDEVTSFQFDAHTVHARHEHGLILMEVTLPPIEDILSTKEVEVSKLLYSGLSNKDIAEHLCRSPHTVKNQVKSILKKLNVNTREEAVLALMEHSI